MSLISNLLGRRLVVGYSLLHNFHLHLTPDDRQVLFNLSGTIVESAKVVDEVEITPKHNEILISIYASLVIWNRQGSPDFKVTKSLQLLPGTYEIKYVGTDGLKTPLKRVEIREGSIVELIEY